ncbi:hypothetical protein GCM10011369_23550 [Neiella marina]|uniref:PAS domain-containing protein n=1 Tax=Neiella marina TaxID=508461 RepID=A0A8J2U618_9GAMM|nr:CHASE4 domain-containing protein [Neiella marina]GGA80890.1 hypothetical protein GCM10011369_23550 [Neiella marina]
MITRESKLASLLGWFVLVLLLAFALLEFGANVWINKHREGIRINRAIDNYGQVATKEIASQIDLLQFLADNLGLHRETIDYLQNRSGHFIERWLNPATLDAMNVEAILIRDEQSAEVAYVTSLANKHNQDIGNLLTNRRFSIARTADDQGFIFIEDMLYMYATSPIFAEQNVASAPRSHSVIPEQTPTGPLVGFFTVLRELDDELLSELGDSLGIYLDVSTLIRPNNPVLVATNEITELKVTSFWRSDKAIGASFSSETQNGETIPIIIETRFELPQGNLMVETVTMVVNVVVFVIVAMLILMANNRLIIRPITLLSAKLHQMKGFGAIADLSLSHRKDEIGSLTRSIDSLLLRLSRQHRYNQLILGSISDALFVVSPNGAISFANTASLKWLRLNEKQLIGQPIDYLIESTEPDASIAHLLTLAHHQDISRSLTVRLVSMPETVDDIHIQLRALSSESSNQDIVIIVRREG